MATPVADPLSGRESGPLLAVSNLRVEFPTRHGTLIAVHDISFAIAPGEVLGVVGESGAGKSVTGAAVIGLIDPPGRIAAGEIRLAGRRIDNLPYEAMRTIRGREIGAVSGPRSPRSIRCTRSAGSWWRLSGPTCRSRQAPRRRVPSHFSRKWEFPRRRGASTIIRINSRVGCASAS